MCKYKRGGRFSKKSQIKLKKRIYSEDLNNPNALLFILKLKNIFLLFSKLFL